MRTPLIDRRAFLQAAGVGFLAALGIEARADTLSTDAIFASAFKRAGGGFGVAVLSERGKVLHSVDLPDRGHDITFDPVSKRSVVFARQPGTFMVVFDHEGRAAPRTIVSSTGRHFFGHGVFSPDGKLLYATENDFENAAGMVGIFDATDNFRRTGEFPTHGVGPHELILLDDGRTIAIANGGVETHPDYGRAELNLATMEPSLVLVDREHGDLIEKHELPPTLHQLSIRHMDMDVEGSLWFGCQHRGPDSERPQLVGRLKPGKSFTLVDLPENVLGGFRNYIGSVAANPLASTVAVSSPQGNSYAIIDAKTGQVVKTSNLTEVCGLAPDGAEFLATTGTGVIAGPAGRVEEDGFVWDNHLLRLPT